ncbi:transporter substrate-binding domain-containing protein [Colwellia sp. 1_MG-2023]|uniref:substrate-binding periplasmic protein n=1 Tax=Colwellia sp. 1_MG-2023 TaxID=3062649 RepID=UPI0026E3996D|nr:transporter substrate-binding domain-containing protein [Colwellia sp. 1_MG-2023]MDO6444610.1 transporter substrate-binding domain-containing protein [Colwellia sp. 1_MG-2023]
MKIITSKWKFKFIPFILLFFCLQPPLANSAKNTEIVKLSIASIDWCPQICPKEVNKGYVQDIVELIYASEKYQLEIHSMPWSRAIKMVDEGKYDALLAPAKDEAPTLIYPSIPIGKQQMCFFVSNASNWLYKGPKSLSSLSIGVAQDTSLEELNEFQASNEKQFQYLPYLDRYVYQSAMMLLKGRIDTFLFTRNTTLFELKQTNLDNQIREAGCLNKSNIYIAFTPSLEKSLKVMSLIKFFEQEMTKYNVNGDVDKIMSKYGIK